MSAPTSQNGTADCCCHSPNRPCPLSHPGKHVHYCLPRGLDLDGHCPDGACPGRCWETTTPTDTTPEPTERRG